MHRASAVDWVAGFFARTAGVNPDKPKKGEREALNVFGERVMLAYDFLEEDLKALRA